MRALPLLVAVRKLGPVPSTFAFAKVQPTVLLVSGQGGPPASYPGPFLPKPVSPERTLAAVHGLLPATADAV
jgi:hypothetical protein